MKINQRSVNDYIAFYDNKPQNICLRFFYFNSIVGPIILGCRIHQLHLCSGVRLPQKCPRYDTKQSDGEASVMLELWAVWSTP